MDSKPIIAFRCERFTPASLERGLALPLTTQLLLLGRDRLLAPISRFAGYFLASRHVFRKDLSRLLIECAADRRGLVWLLLISSVGIVVRIWFLDQPMRYYGHRQGIPQGVFGKSIPQEMLGENGDGDIYVLVQLPGGTYETVRKNYPQLDERDFVARQFPPALLYMPRAPSD